MRRGSRAPADRRRPRLQPLSPAPLVRERGAQEEIEPRQREQDQHALQHVRQRDGGAEAADPGAADERALGRAYRRRRTDDDSARKAKARGYFTVYISSIADRPRAAYYDDARRSAGDGSAARAQRRTRPLSRLRSAHLAAPAEAAPPRLGPPPRALLQASSAADGGRGKFSSPQSLEKSRSQKILGSPYSRD